MPETTFNVIGDPNVLNEGLSDEPFSSQQLADIATVAANIAAITTNAVNGQGWADDAAAAAAAASASATSASSFKDQAATSATAAAGSSTSANSAAIAAALSQSAAAASQTAAATSAAAAATSAASINLSRVLPSGGATGQALRKTGSGDYAVAWQDDAPQSFLSLADVDGSGKADGYRPYWDQGAGKIKFTAPGAATSLAGQSDVTITSVQDKQYIGWNATAGKYTNQDLPAGTGGTITELARLVGATAHTFASVDKDAVRDCDCVAGSVDYTFDDTVAHTVGTRLQGYLNVINASSTNKVNLIGGSAAGPVPNPGTVIPLNKSSGVNGTALTNTLNTAQTVTIPAGAGRAVIILYAVNAANTSNPADSPSFDFAGSNYDWVTSVQANISAPRVFFGVAVLPDSASALVTTFKPNWTDYGGDGNVNSYLALIIPATLVEDGNPYENLGMTQHPTAATSVDSVITIPVGKGNRKEIFAVFRRGNASGDTNAIIATGTGVTQIYEGHTGTAVNNAEMRGCIASRNALPDETDTAHFNLVNSAVHTEVHFTLTPVDGSMLVVGKGGVINPSITSDGLVGFLYNKNAQRVDVAA